MFYYPAPNISTHGVTSRLLLPLKRCFWFQTCWTGWWFHIFFIFTPNIGEMIQFDGAHIFRMGGDFNHQLVKCLRTCSFHLREQVGMTLRTCHSCIRPATLEPWMQFFFPGEGKKCLAVRWPIFNELKYIWDLICYMYILFACIYIYICISNR